MLLALLVYGYATGVGSSRRIERACGEDVAFRVICAQDVPDHATIARFRREHFADDAAMGDLFGQVLVLAARAGLGRLGLIAVDGTKIAAAASKDANRSERRLRELAREIVAQAEAADAAEDELYGDARGDELPADLADPVTRRERIGAALAELEAERKAAQAALERETARQEARRAAWAARRAAGRAGPPGPPPAPASQHGRVRAAAAQLAAAQAAQQAQAQATGPGPGTGPVRNITDPGSRLMPVRGGGFIQGYNAQANWSSDGLCLAAAVTQDTTDYASFAPMMAAAQAAAGLLAAHARGPLHRRRARIGTQLADAGYASEANLACPGPDRLIATGTRRALQAAAAHGGPAPPAAGRGGALAAAMATRLASAPGMAAYRRRGPLAEGPFGNIKHNHGFRRFSMRGLARAHGEWAFQNTVTNLLKIHATGWQPTPA